MSVSTFIWETEGETERERERETLICSTYAFIGCFLSVPWLENAPAILANRDDTLNSYATQPDQHSLFKNIYFTHWQTVHSVLNQVSAYAIYISTLLCFVYLLLKQCYTVLTNRYLNLLVFYIFIDWGKERKNII